MNELFEVIEKKIKEAGLRFVVENAISTCLTIWQAVWNWKSSAVDVRESWLCEV